MSLCHSLCHSQTADGKKPPLKITIRTIAHLLRTMQFVYKRLNHVVEIRNDELSTNKQFLLHKNFFSKNSILLILDNNCTKCSFGNGLRGKLREVSETLFLE